MCGTLDGGGGGGGVGVGVRVGGSCCCVMEWDGMGWDGLGDAETGQEDSDEVM